MQPAFREAVSVKSLTNPLGLYLHIPFCERKCKYCDFYSTFVTEELLNSYTKALIKSIKQWGGLESRPIDTIYFGGGTPSLLSHRLYDILVQIDSSFKILPDTEITLELNPSSNSKHLLETAKKAGVNRLSIGAQSGIDQELNLLGRTHTCADTTQTVNLAKGMGFSNISLDIMLALPNSTSESLMQSLEFINSMDAQHISAYMLKIEENTAFYKEKSALNLPDDDAQAGQYLLMCEFLKEKGYNHYEISNFCKSGMESRHNLKYWKCEEYLGLGPCAHSFLNGKRFFYPRDLKSFINGNSPIDDGFGGDFREFIMLNLRLETGLSLKGTEKKFNITLGEDFFETCQKFKNAGFLNMENDKISLTDEGMLLSNSIITEFLECVI